MADFGEQYEVGLTPSTSKRFRGSLDLFFDEQRKTQHQEDGGSQESPSRSRRRRGVRIRRRR